MAPERLGQQKLASRFLLDHAIGLFYGLLEQKLGTAFINVQVLVVSNVFLCYQGASLIAAFKVSWEDCETMEVGLL
jgi:hypothetical protein